MRKISYFLVVTNLLLAVGGFSVAPQSALADHKDSHNPASPAGGPPGQAKETPTETPAPAPAPAPTPAPQPAPSPTPAATPEVVTPGHDKSDKPDKTQDKAQESKPIPKTPVISAAPPPPLKFEKNLQPGASGEDVQKLQGFLKQFPAIYPEGLVTGNFGQLTQKALKKLQKNLGLPESGTVDEPTRHKLNELDRAIARKKPPKISEIAPAEIVVGTKVTIRGSGFTLENNSLFTRGKVILKGLTSDDGTEITFSLPQLIRC